MKNNNTITNKNNINENYHIENQASNENNYGPTLSSSISPTRSSLRPSTASPTMMSPDNDLKKQRSSLLRSSLLTARGNVSLYIF